MFVLLFHYQCLILILTYFSVPNLRCLELMVKRTTKHFRALEMRVMMISVSLEIYRLLKALLLKKMLLKVEVYALSVCKLFKKLKHDCF